MYTFQNDKVRLRELRREDLDNYARWFSDVEVQRTLGLYAPQSREAEQAWLDGAMNGEGGDYVFAIDAIDGSEPLHIGTCTAHKPDRRNLNCAVGIAIGAKEMWGKGYAVAAFQALLEFCFGELGMNYVYLNVYDFNQRAQRAYQKVGFKEEGRLREAFYREGAYHDVIFMGILRSEWDELYTSPRPSGGEGQGEGLCTPFKMTKCGCGR